MSGLKAIIIDDEPKNRELLTLMLAEYCPTLRIVGMAGGVAEGVRLTKAHKPDIVFLDIRMSRDDEGFEFFQHFDATKAHFDVIFVTAREEYVLRAFNQTFALGYLLKPIDPDELMGIVFKVKQKQRLQATETVLVDDIFKLNDVLYVYIKDDTLRLRLVEGKDKIAKMGKLEDYESLPHFIRANRQYVVNLAFVNKVTDIQDNGEKSRGATALLFNGEDISVSVIRKSYFLKSFEQYLT